MLSLRNVSPLTRKQGQPSLHKLELAVGFNKEMLDLIQCYAPRRAGLQMRASFVQEGLGECMLNARKNECP